MVKRWITIKYLVCMIKNCFSIWEVVSQTCVERVVIDDEVSILGYEPRCTLELKEPGRFYLNTLAATLHGEAALHQFNKGSLVAVQLQYRKEKINDKYVTSVEIEKIMLVNELKEIWL